MSDTITFKINGQETTVPKGTTVMAAARALKVEIPHFCWHPGLSIAGVCRFCMVKVEGRPKLEIACNLQATPGMEVRTDTPEVKNAHKWALEFHLINHPLDCPICDQAGECGLQDYYMKVGKYDSKMTTPKVLKPKALEVGSDLVLDTERCILCSRCVRFEEEVTKTGALGIFDRGDRAIIGTMPDKKITHQYQTNLVDICPVGAFTSKDFRFKQRVWFLKDNDATCPGCATGCQVKVYGKPQTRTYFRIKPRESAVNGFWMCDKGRTTYRHLNQDQRLRWPVLRDGSQKRQAAFDEAVNVLKAKLDTTPVADIALLVSAQYTTEEYTSLFDYFVKQRGVRNVYQWREPTEKAAEFDGMLLRGDRNPNTRGLLDTMKKFGLNAEMKNQFDDVARSKPKVVVALLPEIPDSFPSLGQHLRQLGELPWVCALGMNPQVTTFEGFKVCLPLKGFAEKRGSYQNHAGQTGRLDQPFPALAGTFDVTEVMTMLGVVSGSGGL